MINIISRIINKLMLNYAFIPFYRDERNLLKAIAVSKTHDKTFSEFKNKFAGKDITIVATGPSLNKYKPIENTLTIGVNKSFLKEGLNLDFIFMQDYQVKDYIEKLAEEKYNNITKFIGCAPESYFDCTFKNLSNAIIPESIINKLNARKYFQYCTYNINNVHFSPDIDCNYLECAKSVVFSAMQFALYGNPRRIYIVGCDCSSGHFDGKKEESLKHLIKAWHKLKKFRDIYYPETEIISVNPVGLKGLFTDLYQE